MELEYRQESIYYQSSLNVKGEYIDSLENIPDNVLSKNGCGVICPCNGRRDKIFYDAKSLKQHWNTACHKEWLKHLNDGRPNYYVEYQRLCNVVAEKDKIIQNLKDKLYYTDQLHHDLDVMVLE